MSADVSRQPVCEAGRFQVLPAWVGWFRRHGLTRPDDCLLTAGDIVSGHRDRHVRALTIDRRKFFLKVEHRVPWRVRWRNWRDGHGWVSLSAREAQTIGELRAAGVPAPQVIATGCDALGREFLMLRRIAGADLRRTLQADQLGGLARWRMARSIGQAIARVHAAGYDAPDLSAKHVLVRKSGSISLIDWPRARRSGTVETSPCLRGLAGLHASVATELATPRERMAVLRAWMHELGFRGRTAPLARRVLKVAHTLASKRSIAEQWELGRSPRLRWLAGESLCVTKKFDADLMGRVPDWLCDAAFESVAADCCDMIAGRGALFRFRPVHRIQQWCQRLLGRPPVSPGVRVACLTFRLMRYGVPVTPIMAFGGRADGGGFLLVRQPSRWTSAKTWLSVPRPGRAAVLRQLGRLTRDSQRAGASGISATQLLVTESGRLLLSVTPSLHRCRNSAGQSEVARLAAELGVKSEAELSIMTRAYKSPPRRVNLRRNKLVAPTLRRAA